MAGKLKRSGRKLILTGEIIAKAEKLLRTGNYATVIADHLGIGYSTWFHWLQKGEEAKTGIYRQFLDMVKKTEAAAEMAALAGILTAGMEGNWQALAWFLERKHPDRYGRRDRITAEVSGPNGASLQPPTFVINFTKPKRPPDEIAECEAMKELGPAGGE
jgi:hypothetical protein